jgi:Na+-transporting methylmalonyl-CoA/oxaloacetate decarboxylase gamma subunit
MSLIESILVAVFTMAVVFVVLGMLWAIIRVFSSVIQAVERKGEKTSENNL